MGIDGLASRGLAWVLANWRIEVDRLPAFGEDVTVSTWCYEMSRAHALRNFRISARGEDLVRADSQWFVYDTGSGHATRVPEEQRAYLSTEPPLEMAPLDRRMRPEGDPARRRPSASPDASSTPTATSTTPATWPSPWTRWRPWGRPHRCRP